MTNDQLLDMCVKYIEENGWKDFSFTRVAESNGIAVSLFYDCFKCRSKVPQSVIERIDKSLLTEFEGEVFAESSPREIIFEIILTRLEVARPYKKFIRVLWKEWPADMLSAFLIASRGVGSMGWILDRADLNSAGIGGLVRLQGLTGVYLWTIREWLNDESDDMSKTMASLDQGLERIERIARSLNL